MLSAQAGAWTATPKSPHNADRRQLHPAPQPLAETPKEVGSPHADCAVMCRILPSSARGKSMQNGGYASSRDYRLNCGPRSADRRGRKSRSRGAQRLGRATDRRPLPASKLAGDYAQFAQTCPDSASGIVNACGPGSPDSHRVVWGLTSRPPVPPAGFPPVSRLPAGFSPFARLPLVSRRPAFSGSSPSAVARFRFPFGVPPGSLPLSNLHDSAAAARFRRRWSRAARAKVTSPPPPLAWISP